LTETELWVLDNQPQQQAQFFTQAFAPLFNWLNIHEPALAATSEQALPFWLNTDIPGRKWQQIQQFAKELPTTGNTLEWCAGKGHLGRLRSWQHQCAVVSLEWQEALCAQGQKNAQRLKLPQSFICGNAFHLPLADNSHIPVWAALHACGDLHVQFLRTAQQNAAQHIVLAPCCYHRQQASYYEPLSQTGQGAQLVLNGQALRLAQQNQITAGQSERNARAQALNWRLGYELLRQAHQPNTGYQPLPSCKTGLLRNFEQFCQWAAKHHHFNLPADISDYEEKGQAQRLHMMRQDAIRHCFRRPLELWLLLDKAAYLEEQGYQTQLLQFCEPHITPRNLLLKANRL
jgi:hypothetical protein